MSTSSNGNKKDLHPEFLSIYGTMLSWLFISTICVVSLIVATIALAFFSEWESYTLLYVNLAGALGGFISSLTRLYRLKELPALLGSPNFKVIRNKYIAMYALIPPLVGIVASTVVYLVVAAELIDSPMFAHYRCIKPGDLKDCDQLGMAGLFYFSPDTVKDTAKALVWGFISGFSERFFPSVVKNIDKNR